MILDSRAQTHRTSWFTPAQCKNYYGVPYQFREIQIHWWNDPATKPTHQGVVDYIANKKAGSVNYVTSAGRVTSMVPEENCALTTQNGNPYGIKIECSPYGTAGDYDTVGWLVAQIWKRRGKLPLVPHKKYWNTACPGTLDLNRIKAEAEKHYKGEQAMVIGPENNWRARMNRLHWQIVGNWNMSDATFKGIVGKDAWSVVENWSDHPNSQQAIDDQILGEKSRKGNWQGQIDELTKTVVAQNGTINELYKEIEVLKAQMTEDTEGLNKFGEALAWLLKRLGLKG